MTERSDDRLMIDYVAGDENALRILVERWQRIVTNQTGNSRAGSSALPGTRLAAASGAEKSFAGYL